MTKHELLTIASKLSFRDWVFRIEEKGDGFLLQVRFTGKDSVTGKPELQSCRKWYISSHSTHVEVLRTAWKAVLAAIEHEAGEDFKYEGVAVYNPHLDPRIPTEVRRLDSRAAPKPAPGLVRGDTTVVLARVPEMRQIERNWYFDDANKQWQGKD